MAVFHSSSLCPLSVRRVQVPPFKHILLFIINLLNVPCSLVHDGSFTELKYIMCIKCVTCLKDTPC